MENLSALQWRHNRRDSVSNHQPHDCLLNRLFRRGSKKTSKLRVTGLCTGNSPVPGEFSTQMASNAEIVSIWWRHHGFTALCLMKTDSLLKKPVIRKASSCRDVKIFNSELRCSKVLNFDRRFNNCHSAFGFILDVFVPLDGVLL